MGSSFSVRMDNKTLHAELNETFWTYERPFCYTTVAWRTVLSANQNIAIGASYSIAILPSILLNSALSYALYKTGQLKKKSRLLVCCLSLSDLFSGLVTIPGSAVLFAVYGKTRICHFERPFLFVGQVNGHFSLYVLVLIAMQRYFAVKPRTALSHNRIVEFAFFSNKGLAVVLAFVFAWSVLHGLVTVYFFGHVKSGAPNLFMVIVRAIFLIVTLFLYFRLYYSIRQHRVSMASNHTSVLGHASSAHTLPMKRNYDTFSRTLFLVLVAFIISYIPVILTDCWTGYYTFKKMQVPNTARFCFYLSFSTLYLFSTLNTAIFLRRDKAAMSILAGLFFGKKRKSHRHNQDRYQ